MKSHRVRDTVTWLQRETPEFIPRDVATNSHRRIWIRWTTSSGVSFKRRSTVYGSMMWRSWRNVCWGSGGCWTTPSSRQRLRTAKWRVVVWAHVFVIVWMMGMTFWCVFVRFIDTGFHKFDRYKHVQSASIAWNVLLMCLRLLHGTVANRMNVWQDILALVTLAFSCKVMYENCENPSILIKVTVKKIIGTFLCGHGVERANGRQTELQQHTPHFGQLCAVKLSDVYHELMKIVFALYQMWNVQILEMYVVLRFELSVAIIRLHYIRKLPNIR